MRDFSGGSKSCAVQRFTVKIPGEREPCLGMCVGLFVCPPYREIMAKRLRSWRKADHCRSIFGLERMEIE